VRSFDLEENMAKKYEVTVTVCDVCGETRVRYPLIPVGDTDRFSKGRDVLCRCEREHQADLLVELMEKIVEKLNKE